MHLIFSYEWPFLQKRMAKWPSIHSTQWSKSFPDQSKHFYFKEYDPPLKFRFSWKATKIAVIFRLDLTFTQPRTDNLLMDRLKPCIQSRFLSKSFEKYFQINDFDIKSQGNIDSSFVAFLENLTVEKFACMNLYSFTYYCLVD